MAETLDIISAADVTARLSTQAYTRLYARNGGATVPKRLSRLSLVLFCVPWSQSQ